MSRVEAFQSILARHYERDYDPDGTVGRDLATLQDTCGPRVIDRLLFLGFLIATKKVTEWPE